MSRVSNDIEREIAAAMRDCIGENEAVLEQTRRRRWQSGGEAPESREPQAFRQVREGLD